MSDEGQLGSHRSAPVDDTYDDTYDDDLTSDVNTAPTPQPAGHADRADWVDRAAEPATGPSAAADPAGSATAAAAAESSAARTGWERSLFEGDQGPGVPGYAPVEPSGPRTPPKPGTPSSGNLR